MAQVYGYNKEWERCLAKMVSKRKKKKKSVKDKRRKRKVGLFKDLKTQSWRYPGGSYRFAGSLAP